MFTGIVTAIGTVESAVALGPALGFGKRLRIAAPAGYLHDVVPGDSVAVNGACMTVTASDATAGWFEIEVSAESLQRTSGLDATGPVNLELALRASDRLGGHLVSGHVDGVGRVVHFEAIGESWRLVVSVARDLAAFAAVKGSIVVNGVSLTINAVVDGPEDCRVEINLIPHTVQCTTLGNLRQGSIVNVEIDLIARYVARILEVRDFEIPCKRAPSS